MKTSGIFLLIGLVLTLVSTGCSNSSNKASNKTTISITKFPPEPGRSSPITINEDSANLFLSERKFIRASKKANKPFSNLIYNKVIAYDYDGGKGVGVIEIITDGKICPTVKKQKELTQVQVDGLTYYLGANATYGGTKAFCFEPHLGIVFYKDSKVVAHVSICLECNYLSSAIKIPATEINKIKIGDDYEYPTEGFSKSGREKINTLCKQLNFSHCADTLNSVFDD